MDVMSTLSQTVLKLREMKGGYDVGVDSRARADNDGENTAIGGRPLTGAECG